MLNELEEFKAYTTPVKYEVNRKGDTAFLGRFTFESLLNFEGLGRILTVLVRGYSATPSTICLDSLRLPL